MTQLGRLEKLNPRTIWQHEATQFTPWLAEEENLSLLSDALGMDLELIAQEQPVGPYRADLVCTNRVDESMVLIENQLEKTDHNHLGQLITYAAGLDAVTLIWIAPRITDEHRAAMDWLNSITDNHFSIFGLVIELWRIADSPIAPKFNIVSSPNDWTKGGAARKLLTSETSLSKTKLLQQSFWRGLKDYMSEQGSRLKPQSPQPQHWLTVSIGRSGFHLAALVNTREQVIAIELYLGNEYAKEHYDLLYLDKEQIEQEIGATLDWRKLPDKKASRILIAKGPEDIENQDAWPSQYEWLATKLEQMHAVFQQRVLALPSEYPPDDSGSLSN